MKARVPLSYKQKKLIHETVVQETEAVQRDVGLRAQYQWGLAMLQAGLSPRTVRRVIKLLPAVEEKYREYQTEKLGDLFCQQTLEEQGVTLPMTRRPI